MSDERNIPIRICLTSEEWASFACLARIQGYNDVPEAVESMLTKMTYEIMKEVTAQEVRDARKEFLKDKD